MNLIVTPEALQDLKDIRKYISDELASPKAAENTIRKIISTYKKLIDTPLMGTTLSQSIRLDVPFHYLISGNYLIFYKITENIEIHRIIYGRRDYIRILFGDNLTEEPDDEI